MIKKTPLDCNLSIIGGVADRKQSAVSRQDLNTG